MGLDGGLGPGLAVVWAARLCAGLGADNFVCLFCVLLYVFAGYWVLSFCLFYFFWVFSCVLLWVCLVFGVFHLKKEFLCRVCVFL